MSYANAIRGIAPGSTWIAGDGVKATVRTAAASHVVYTREFGQAPQRLEVVLEAAFRAAFRPLYDRAAVRSQFSMSCANLGEFRVFWLPAPLSRILCRSVSCTRHFAVPDGALLVGIYASPCSPQQFLDDLDDLLSNGAEP